MLRGRGSAFVDHRSSGRRLISPGRRIRVLVGGTGVGKTEVLRALGQHGEPVLDLEEIAQHRGSAFGGIGSRAQPSQRQFAEAIALALDGAGRLWLEHEGPYLGQVALPRELVVAMSRAPAVELFDDPVSRIERLHALYEGVGDSQLVEAIERMRPRLPVERAQGAVRAILGGDRRRAIRFLLPYYDRAYFHQQRARAGRLTATVRVSGHSPWQIANTLLRIAP